MLDPALYQSIFANSPISACILSPSADPTILDANDAFLRNVAHTREQLVGKRLFAALPEDPDDPNDTGVAALGNALARVINTVQPQSLPAQRYPIRTIGEDGAEVFVERFWNTVNTPIVDAHGTLLCIHHVSTEVTEQKRSEEALREADRRKDEFLATLAHELRNPLAPIMVAAELLGHASVDLERVKRTGAVILRQVKHLTSLVDDLLDVSRVTRGLVVIDRQRVDLREILAQAVEQVTPLLQTRRHQFEVHPQAQPLVVCGDAKRLIQVLANLLNNAVKYTPPGGRIAVETRIDGAWALVGVSDNGIGMSEDLIARAFELFTQAERGADRTQSGLGIGLAVVKRLVELHGGSVLVQSGGPGQGSRFTVSIPLADSSEGLVPAPSPLPAANAPLNVMVVDDNLDAARMLSLMIEACGYRVRTEHGVREALAAAAAEPADVYLLDIGVAETDGLALAQHLRACPATRDAVLIAVTGYGRLDGRAAGTRAGFDFHFVKPIDSEDLAGLLRDIAMRSRRASPERRHGASRAWPASLAPS